MEEKRLPEYTGYTVPDLARFLREHNINWNRSCVSLKDGKHVIEPAKIDYSTHEVLTGEDKNFSFIHVSPFELELRYKGDFFDLSQEWVENLAKNDKTYFEYNKTYLAQEKEKWEGYRTAYATTEERNKVIDRNLCDIANKMEKLAIAEKTLQGDKEV